jgi:hypothetical protein
VKPWSTLKLKVCLSTVYVNLPSVLCILERKSLVTVLKLPENTENSASMTEPLATAL